MSKFELFKKLNLLLRISGVSSDPQYCGMLDISRPSPSDVYVGKFSELASGSGVERIDTYPNPMAVKFLMEVCEDVLHSRVPNRKDEFQLVALAFDMAIKRTSLAVVENGRHVFYDCEPLMHNYIDGGCEGSSTSSEIRNTLDTFNLNNAYVESAVSNTLSHPSNMNYVTRLSIDPKICLLAYMFNDADLLDLVKHKILGETRPDDTAPVNSDAPKRIYSPLEAMIALGIIEYNINLSHIEAGSKINATLLGKSLAKDFETAIHHWSTDPSNRKDEFKLNHSWYKENIESVEGLETLMMELLNFNNFVLLGNQKKRNALLADLARAESNKKNLVLDDTPHKLSTESKLRSLEKHAQESSKHIVKALDSVRMRLVLVKFGLVVRNPLYDTRDEMLEHNPPLILSGFGVVVAQYAMSKPSVLGESLSAGANDD